MSTEVRISKLWPKQGIEETICISPGKGRALETYSWGRLLIRCDRDDAFTTVSFMRTRTLEIADRNSGERRECVIQYKSTDALKILKGEEAHLRDCLDLDTPRSITISHE